MGTRSLTAFINKARQSQEICVVYRQYDGYPEGHGLELAQFLNDEKLEYNGIGCLAAQVISHLKNGWGGVYVEPANARDLGEEYIYEVHSDDKGMIKISCFDVWNDKFIFVGTPEKFIAKYKKEKVTK